MSSITSFDSTVLNDYLNNNQSDVKDMIKLFLTTIPPLIEKLKDHTAKQNWKQVNYIAHRFKPSLDILGFHNSKEKAEIIEKMAETEKEIDTINRFVNELENDIQQIINILKKELEKM